MLKNLIQSFLPWILYSALVGNTQRQLEIAIIVAAITSILFELKQLRKGFILSWGTLIFFIFMFLTVVVFKSQWVQTDLWLLCNAALAIIVWVSILVRRPFTIQYAKEMVAKDKWQHPLFLKINYILSSVWGLIFLFGVIIHIVKLYYPIFGGKHAEIMLNPWVFNIITSVPAIFGIWFTIWFPDWYKAKAISLKAQTAAR